MPSAGTSGRCRIARRAEPHERLADAACGSPRPGRRTRTAPGGSPAPARPPAAPVPPPPAHPRSSLEKPLGDEHAGRGEGPLDAPLVLRGGDVARRLEGLREELVAPGIFRPR